MNILILDSWLREYLTTDASPQQISECLSLCGPSVEKVTSKDDDFIYDIEITSNRVDMASIYGIAREAQAILPRFGIKTQLKPLCVKPHAESVNKLPLKIEDDKHLCNRVLAVVLENVKAIKSPDYIKRRLELSGIRSLNLLIDITNYIMLETGFPLHVFDYDRVKTNKLIIRNAKNGESLTTLDNKICFLEKSDVIIDDGTGRIVDLPGIMGTENSVVTDKTERIILFAESNQPIIIRQTSMRLGIRTLAATINEKHLDPCLYIFAFKKAINMYHDLLSGTPASPVIDLYPNPIKTREVNVSIPFIQNRLGINLEKNVISDILKSLSFKVVDKDDNLIVTAPTYRSADINIPEDIVEEVARIYGYHNFPSNLMKGNLPIRATSHIDAVSAKIKIMLKFWGYTEIYNYSFISEKLILKSGLLPKNHVQLVNPLTEDFKYLRHSLIPSILQTVNANQFLKDKLFLFELAKTYNISQDKLPEEKYELVITCQTDFFELKGIVLQMLSELGIKNYKEVPEKKDMLFHPLQSLCIVKENNTLSTLGKINPKVEAEFGIRNSLYITRIDFGRLVKYFNTVRKYTPIPIYPPVIEYITLKLSPGKKIGDMLEEIKGINPLISDVKLVSKFNENFNFQLTYLNPLGNLSKEKVRYINEQIKKLTA